MKIKLKDSLKFVLFLVCYCQSMQNVKCYNSLLFKTFQTWLEFTILNKCLKVYLIKATKLLCDINFIISVIYRLNVWLLNLLLKNIKLQLFNLDKVQVFKLRVFKVYTTLLICFANICKFFADTN